MSEGGHARYGERDRGQAKLEQLSPKGAGEREGMREQCYVTPGTASCLPFN